MHGAYCNVNTEWNMGFSKEQQQSLCNCKALQKIHSIEQRLAKQRVERAMNIIELDLFHGKPVNWDAVYAAVRGEEKNENPTP